MIVTLTAIRSCLLLLALFVLLYVGKKPHIRKGTGWLCITTGFGLVALGSLLQLGPHLPFLDGHPVFADPETNKIVAEIFGFYLGICFVCIGLWKMGPLLYAFYVSEKKLVESERNLKTLVDTSIEGMVIIQEGCIVFANPSLERMLGVGPGELIGTKAMDFIAEPDHDRVYARRDAITARRDERGISEYRLLNVNGEIRFALISSQYIDWRGRDAFLSVISDITDLKQVEESLSAIANTASESIGIFQDEHLVYCNPAMIDTFGFTLEELRERPFYEFVHPEDRQMLKDRYEARQAGKDVPAQYDYRLIGKGGKLFWVMISAGTTHWKGRMATVTILTNVTARKRVEEELRLAKEGLEVRVEERTRDLRLINDQLIAVSNQKSAFVSAASHELRTPLASILGFSALVKKILEKHVLPAVDDRPDLCEKIRVARSNLDIIRTEGDRLTRLLDDMLDVSKIEAGQAEWRDEPLSVRAVADIAAATARVKLDGKPGVALRTAFDDTPHHVVADPDRIMQVITNLLDNAVKFTDCGQVTVSTGLAREDVVEVRVTDTGAGMTEEERGWSSRSTTRRNPLPRASPRPPRAPASAWPSARRSSSITGA